MLRLASKRAMDSLTSLSKHATPRAGFLSRLVRSAILKWHRSKGWRSYDETGGGIEKAVILAAPHTTNWDFIHYLGATDDLGIFPRFMGKTSLFKWPMTRFMLEMGGVPVDRSQRRDMVTQMVERFGVEENFLLTIAPEGTREGATRWKTGFYQIAMKARVPVICGVINYQNKTVHLRGPIWPTGDYRADLEKILAHYADSVGKNPEHTIVGKADVDAFI